MNIKQVVIAVNTAEGSSHRVAFDAYGRRTSGTEEAEAAVKAALSQLGEAEPPEEDEPDTAPGRRPGDVPTPVQRATPADTGAAAASETSPDDSDEDAGDDEDDLGDDSDEGEAE